MKKLLCLSFCILFVFSLAACKGKDASISDIDETEMSEPDASENEASNDNEDVEVDVDLTVLSGNMLYSQVYNIMMSPDDYIGKTVKMEGMFTHFYDEAKDKHYYACIIQDAAACCSQGIEFVPTEEFAHPEDRIEEGGAVTVVGTFDAYKEGVYDYLTLKNAKLL